jgi:hypothetical protein
LIRPEDNKSTLLNTDIQGISQNAKSIPFPESFTQITNSYGKNSLFIAKVYRGKRQGDKVSSVFGKILSMESEERG